MIRLEALRPGEVRDRPADLDGAVESAAGERQGLHRFREESLGVLGKGAGPSRDRPGEVGVARHTEPRPAPALPVAGLLDPGSRDRGRLARRRTEQLLLREPRDAQADVDPIQERSRQLVPVELDAVGPADALLHAVAVEAARTRVGGRDEREPGGELHGSDGARDDDTTVFERLPKSLDGIATELGELIEEQDPVMREADFSRSHMRAAAAEQPDGRDRMVRRAERASAEQTPGRTEQSGDGVELGRFQRFLPRELGQDRRQSSREHRLPGAG
jgi:hypothetical protein